MLSVNNLSTLRKFIQDILVEIKFISKDPTITAELDKAPVHLLCSKHYSRCFAYVNSKSSWCFEEIFITISISKCFTDEGTDEGTGFQGIC